MGGGGSALTLARTLTLIAWGFGPLGSHWGGANIGDKVIVSYGDDAMVSHSRDKVRVRVRP